jgi:hypothetical protein
MCNVILGINCIKSSYGGAKCAFMIIEGLILDAGAQFLRRPVLVPT